MNDNIDKNEIRKAIDRLQAEHPCGIVYDPAVFVSMEAVDTIKECVDKIARRMMEDTEINIICEFAKLYLDGARPTIERPHGAWIPCKDDNFCKCSECKQIVMSEERSNFCPNCGSDNRPRILDEAVDGEGKDGNVKEGEAK